MDEEKQQAYDRLAAAGRKYEAARTSYNKAREVLDPLIIEALKAGVGPGEVQKLSHLSPQTVRTIARIAKIEPATRGGAR